MGKTTKTVNALNQKFRPPGNDDFAKTLFENNYFDWAVMAEEKYTFTVRQEKNAWKVDLHAPLPKGKSYKIGTLTFNNIGQQNNGNDISCDNGTIKELINQNISFTQIVQNQKKKDKATTTASDTPKNAEKQKENEQIAAVFLAMHQKVQTLIEELSENAFAINLEKYKDLLEKMLRDPKQQEILEFKINQLMDSEAGILRPIAIGTPFTTLLISIAGTVASLLILSSYPHMSDTLQILLGTGGGLLLSGAVISAAILVINLYDAYYGTKFTNAVQELVQNAKELNPDNLLAIKALLGESNELTDLGNSNVTAESTSSSIAKVNQTPQTTEPTHYSVERYGADNYYRFFKHTPTSSGSSSTKKQNASTNTTPGFTKTEIAST